MSADQTGGGERLLDETVASAGLRTWRDNLLTRLAAKYRGKSSGGTIAAIARNPRSQRLVTLLRLIVARTPRVAQRRPVWTDSECGDDGQNGELRHGGRCYWQSKTKANTESSHGNGTGAEAGCDRGILRGGGENSSPRSGAS